MFPASEPHIRTRLVQLANGLRLRVAEAGRGDALPLLLLHGWGASIYMWRSWFAPLAAEGRRVIAVDLPGHGLSDKPEDDTAYRLPPMIEAVRDLLDVERLSRLEVVAQSMAGTIALELLLAGEPRITRLGLVNPAGFGVVPLLGMTRALSFRWVSRAMPYLVTRRSVMRAHRLVYSDASRITQQDIDQYWAPSQYPAYARALWRLASQFEWERPAAEEMAARLREVKVPVHVVLGGRDRLVRGAQPYVAELVAAGAPLDVSVVESGGHAVNEERAREVMERLSLLRHVDASVPIR